MCEPAPRNKPAIVLNENETHPLKLQTILAATDLSANSLVATQYACNLAKLTQSTIILLHVFELPAFASKPDIYFSSRDVTFEFDAAQSAALDRLHTIRDEIVNPQVSCVSNMRIGIPYEEIVDEAEKRRADLIVVGTQGMSGVAKFLMGSTAERVCRHAACSVVVVRHGPTSQELSSTGETAGELKLRKILVPTDLSKNSVTAINYATRLAKLTGAHLRLTHVFQIPDYATNPGISLSPTAPQSDIAAAQCRALDHLQSLCENVTASGSKCDAGMRTGVPSQEIIAEAEKIAPDLIVVGTQGATAIARFLMGSTAERVLRHAPCPVLVARDSSTGRGVDEA
jgi:nucleotide-binding universal stress UspA family protein